MAVQTRNEIKTGKIYIKDVFDGWYSVPEYQRPYVWSREEVIDLLDDVSFAALNTPYDDYFLGSYVYQFRPAGESQQFDESDLLDGQQRITTLFLLFAVIRDIDPSDKRKKNCQAYIFQEEDQDTNTPERVRLLYKIRPEVELFINEFIKPIGSITNRLGELNDLAKNATDPSIKNMSNALITIKEYFEKHQNIESFFPYLLKNVLLIYVSSQHLEDAFRLFTILNDRGVKLRNSDILKAQNLQHVKSDSDKIKYGRRWEELESELGEEFDRFLSFVRTIIVKEKARLSLLNEFQENIYDPKEKDKKTGLIKPKLLNRGKETFEIIDSFYRHYDQLFNNDNHDFTNGFEFNNLLVCMNSTLPSTDWIPPLLAYYNKFKKNDIYTFLVKLDNKFTGDWIAQKSPTERIESMNAILKSIELSQSPNDLFTTDLFDFNSDDFIRNLEGNIYGRQFAKCILLKLDFIFNDNKTTKWSKFSQITIEHILPQNPENTSKWLTDFTDVQKDELVNKIGNLILLGRAKNSSQGRLDYVDKHKKYFAGNINTFPNSLRVFNKYRTQWTPAELTENQNFVLAVLKQHFNIL